MTGSTAAIITIPIVTALGLFTWLAMVLYASSHPHWRHHQQPPKTEVAGGSFRAVEGGRQVMPIPERDPAGVPAQRAAAAEESYDTASARAADATAAHGPEPAESAGAGRSAGATATATQGRDR